MYDVVFYYIYLQQISKGKSAGFARFNGALVVFLATCFHISLVIAVIQKYFKRKIDIGFLTHNKIFEYSFFLFCIALAYRYYTDKKIERIEAKYCEKEWFKSYGEAITLLLLFVPLIAFIIILS